MVAQAAEFLGVAQLVGVDDLVELAACRRDTAGPAARWRARPAAATDARRGPAPPRRPSPSASRSGPGRRRSRRRLPARRRPRSPRPGRRSPGSRSNRCWSSPVSFDWPSAFSWSCESSLSSSCRSADSSPSLRSRISWRAARAKASWLPSASRQLLEVAAGGRFDVGAPQVDHRLGRFGRRGAQQLLAGDQADHVGDRRVVLGLDAGMAALVGALAPQRREIVGDAGHAAGAERLDADLLDRLEDRARRLAARHAAADAVLRS